MKSIIALFSIFLSVLLSGCVTPEPYDYTALKASAPRSIVVIPPLNESIEADAQYKYLATISRPLAEKGYYVFPVALIDSFLKENGLPTPAEMNSVPLDKIREHIGADAVLYVTIKEWGQKYIVVDSVTIVKAELKLVDTKTGTLLWDAEAHARYSPNNNNQGGPLGLLINAVVTQISASISDYTPQTARIANHHAINNQHRGLLNGPYVEPAGENVTESTE